MLSADVAAVSCTHPMHHCNCTYCRLQRGWLWGSIAFARRGGRHETIIGERVPHFALTSQGILTKCVRGVTFKGPRIDERHDWRWTPTTNQDVSNSTTAPDCALLAMHGCELTTRDPLRAPRPATIMRAAAMRVLLQESA
jgi:hypothetical protein